MTYRKKLIEVALPLEEINKQSARENYIYKGNPSAIHKWWAQRPLAACRAVLFASLVDDPSEYMPNEKAAHDERERLFDIIEELVVWENSNNEDTLRKARLEIARCVARNLDVDVPIGDAAIREFLASKAPPVLDPFAGGGSIPLEAQRLGLRAYASDLNPVAVLINKALIEIPPRFANRPPVHPPENGQAQMMHEWRGAAGLAEDVRYYGQWMRDEAEKRIGLVYPKVKLPKEYGGGEATVNAWLWARTVKCPNPACGATMPLARSFKISTKKGKQTWAYPIADRQSKTVKFVVKVGETSGPEGTVNRRGAACLCCGTPVPLDYIRAEGRAKRIGAQLMAVAAESTMGRVYISPTEMHERFAVQANAEDVPDTDLPEQALGFRVQLYGMTKHRDLFTSRQLKMLETLSQLVSVARLQVQKDALAVGWSDDSRSMESGGEGPIAYADAVATYLAFGCDKYSMYGCSLVPWYAKEDRPSMLFGRQTLSMVWDFTEINPFTDIGGSIIKSIGIVADSIAPLIGTIPGTAVQGDATSELAIGKAIISTDPPYYDNVPYADLSDFFYVWLRRCLQVVYPSLFSTLLVPKKEELVADPFRYGSSANAEAHFVSGIREAFTQIRRSGHADYPVSVYYAFKQAESQDDDEEENGSAIASTGWEVMLEGLMKSGFRITGTWPMRTERTGRLRDTGSNALASSIVLICRLRENDAPISTRREFIASLKRELPGALKELQQGYIAPVDLAQAVIGPGMAVFSRFSQVLDADGSPMHVRAALALINQTLDEFLTEQEGEFDTDTRWALAWFEQFGHNEGAFGDAETLSKAKNTSVNGLVHAGILEARSGKVRLLNRDELKPPSPVARSVRDGRGAGGEGWTPENDDRRAVWEATQYLIRALDEGGEQAAADLLRRLGSLGETARDLAYRLYSICERKGWASDALAYNMLAAAWPRLTELAARSTARQDALL